jgi:heme/copper-type cytochrome/quinol oxidase subunit 2
MTNIQGLYFCVAVALIVAVIYVYMVVKGNKDRDYNRGDNPGRAAKYSAVGILMYPLFIVLGICMIFIVLLFHFS